jgi:deoxyribodipyrimidine photolyase
VSLKWGIVSARTLKNKVIASANYPTTGSEHYIAELIWREFYRYILLHYPQVLDIEFQAKFRDGFAKNS